MPSKAAPSADRRLPNNAAGMRKEPRRAGRQSERSERLERFVRAVFLSDEASHAPQLPVPPLRVFHLSLES